MGSRFDDSLLDSVAVRTEALLAAPDADFLALAREFVGQLLRTRRPDGTAPEPELIQEVLRSVRAIVEDRLLEQQRATAGPGTEVAWITAWRECADDLELLRRMLAELQDEPNDAGVPPISPLAHGALRVVDTDASRVTSGRSRPR